MERLPLIGIKPTSSAKRSDGARYGEQAELEIQG